MNAAAQALKIRKKSLNAVGSKFMGHLLGKIIAWKRNPTRQCLHSAF
jgi:hypothetical protein